MSTRSNIAIEDPKTKKVKVIYVHSDGYPYGVGKCLVDHYNHYDLAKQLFTEGDASYLGDTFAECSFYGRDWDRKEEPARTFRDGQWLVSDNYSKAELEFVPVKEHKDYSGKHKGMTEVEMISQIGKALSGAGFKDENISMQSWESKKKLN